MIELSEIDTQTLIQELQNRDILCYENRDEAMRDFDDWELNDEVSNRGCAPDIDSEMVTEDMLDYLESRNYKCYLGDVVDPDETLNLMDYLVENFKRKDFPLNLVQYIESMTSRVLL